MTEQIPTRLRAKRARATYVWQSYIILALLFITMFSFGGVEPFSVPIALIGSGALLTLLSLGQWKGWISIRLGFWSCAAAGLFLFVLGWGYAQTLQGMPPAWHHPSWSILSDFLERTVNASIGIDAFAARRELQWYLVYAVIFVCSLVLSRSKTATDRVIYGFLGLQLFFALFSFVVLASSLDSTLGIFGRGYSGNLTSTLINRNSYAGFVGMGLCLAAACMASIFRSTSERRESQSWLSWLTGQKSIKYIAALAGFSVLLILVLVGTGSRAGLGTSLVGAGTIVIITQLRAMTWKKAGIGLAIIIVLFSVLSSSDILQRIQPNSLDSGVVMRQEIISLSVRAFLERPVLGVGLGGYSQIITSFMDIQDVEPRILLSAHNTYLEVLIELGLIGAIPLFCLIAGILVYALYPTNQPYTVLQLCLIGLIVQLGIHSLVDFTLEIPSNFMAAAMLGGAACGQRFYLSQDQRRNGQAAQPKPTQRKPAPA